MTGIERHWKEIDDAERALKIAEYSRLSDRLTQLSMEIYPQQYAMSQMANAAYQNSVGVSAGSLIQSLIGDITGTGATGTGVW